MPKKKTSLSEKLGGLNISQNLRSRNKSQFSSSSSSIVVTSISAAAATQHDLPPPSNVDAPSRKLATKRTGNSVANQLQPHIEATSEKRRREMLDKIFNDGRAGKFPAKFIEFGDFRKAYSTVLQFYECETTYVNKPGKTEMVKFKCVICTRTYRAKLGRTHNLNRHIKCDHKDKAEVVEWFNEYDKVNNKKKESDGLNESTMDLVRYFISSNAALSEFKNKHLRKILNKANIKMSSYRLFKNKILPDVMSELKSKIQFKLQSASTICLVTDIWTNNQMLDFISVSANLIFDNFEKEIIVLGIELN